VIAPLWYESHDTSANAAASITTTAPSSHNLAGDLYLETITYTGGTGTTLTPPAGRTLVWRRDVSTSLGVAVYQYILGSGGNQNYGAAPNCDLVSCVSGFYGCDPAVPVTLLAETDNPSDATWPSLAAQAAVPGACVVAVFGGLVAGGGLVTVAAPFRLVDGFSGSSVTLSQATAVWYAGAAGPVGPAVGKPLVAGLSIAGLLQLNASRGYVEQPVAARFASTGVQRVAVR